MAKPETSAAAAAQTSESTPVKIIDLTKSDDNALARCLVKYKEIDAPKWMAVAEIRQTYPRLLIDYYESRMTIMPKK